MGIDLSVNTLERARSTQIAKTKPSFELLRVLLSCLRLTVGAEHLANEKMGRPWGEQHRLISFVHWRRELDALESELIFVFGWVFFFFFSQHI